MKTTTTWLNPATDNTLRVTGTVYPRTYDTREQPGEEASADVEKVELMLENGEYTALAVELIPDEAIEQLERALIQAAAETQYENEY